MTLIFILTAILFHPPIPPGCLRGPDVFVWDVFCTPFDVHLDYRIDLLDFAEIQVRWECDGHHEVVRAVEAWGECGE